MKTLSLFRKLVEIHYEQVKAKRALRILSKQTWSVEFLTALVAKAAKINKSGIELVLSDKEGHSIHIRSIERESALAQADDYDILNHIDDATAVNDFIAKHSTR